jgi:hypothetical protein
MLLRAGLGQTAVKVKLLHACSNGSAEHATNYQNIKHKRSFGLRDCIKPVWGERETPASSTQG